MYQGTESSKVLFTETLITTPVGIVLHKKTNTKQYLWHKGQRWQLGFILGAFSLMEHDWLDQHLGF